MGTTKKPEGGPVGNLKAQTHGGGAGIAKLASGEPFTGLAAEQEKAVRALVGFAGRQTVMFDNAIRLQTVADLYYAAAKKAFDSGDFDKIDAVVKRYGWLSTAALRAWSAVGMEEEKQKGKIIDASVILASLKGGEGGDNGSDTDND